MEKCQRILIKIWRSQKKKYYEQTLQNAVNNKKPYTQEEIDMILEHKLSDRELSVLLGRSMKAIQKKRYQEKNKNK